MKLSTFPVLLVLILVQVFLCLFYASQFPAAVTTTSNNGDPTIDWMNCWKQTKQQQQQKQHRFRRAEPKVHAHNAVDNKSNNYQPSPLETFARSHGSQLGYDQVGIPAADGCNIWRQSPLPEFQMYRKELKEYTRRLSQFQSPIKDLRYHLSAENDDHNDHHDNKSDDMNNHNKNGTTMKGVSICDTLELHPDGLQGIFRNSHGLSQFPGGAGFVEPLLPPFRHPESCFQFDHHLLDMSYLVHDFAALCRHKLKKRSRTVLVDMGASLDFHSTWWGNQHGNNHNNPNNNNNNRNDYSPAIYLMAMYQKFGFRFDHIYAYESTAQDPELVYQLIPDDVKAAYHWFNVGVDANLESFKNPFQLLLQNFNEGDFVVVKLDIDTSWIEVPMVQLLLREEKLQNLVDCFYFEHHVHMEQMRYHWTDSMQGSVMDSLQLFSTLREKGIAVHYWP